MEVPDVKPEPQLPAAEKEPDWISEDPEIVKRPLLTKSVSIKEPIAKKQAVAEPEEDPLAKLKNDFTEEQLQAAWSGYTEKVRQEGKSSLFAILTAYPPKLLANYAVEFSLEHKAQEITFEEIRTELSVWLRRELQNGHIQVKPVILQVVEKRIPVSAEDKFELMAKENPAIVHLRKSLGLDLDY